MRISTHAALMVALAPLTAAFATEGGGTSKIQGIETVMAGVMPPAGTLRLFSALGHYRSSRTLGGDGQPRANLSNFRIQATGLAARLQYVWPDFELLGANVETRIGYAFYSVTRLSFDVGTPAGALHRAGSAQGSGDLIFAPFTLGWHGAQLHQIAGVEFYVPTGGFDTSRLVNPGRGYLAAAPAYRFTWFPRSEMEISGNLVLLINRENSDSGVRSGRELSFDYGVGWALAPGWQLGASGYLYRQLGDDQLHGVRVAPDGNRGRVMAAGPFLRWFTPDGLGITFKWQIESGARNRSDGNRFFVHVARNL